MKKGKDRKRFEKLGRQFERLSVELIEISAKREKIMGEWYRLFRKLYR